MMSNKNYDRFAPPTLEEELEIHSKFDNQPKSKKKKSKYKNDHTKLLTVNKKQ